MTFLSSLRIIGSVAFLDNALTSISLPVRLELINGNAFSGKLAESNFIKGFVPTMYDTLDDSGFYKQGEVKLNALNAEIDALEQDAAFHAAKRQLKTDLETFDAELKGFKVTLKEKKKAREAAKAYLSQADYAVLLEDLRKESVCICMPKPYNLHIL